MNTQGTHTSPNRAAAGADTYHRDPQWPGPGVRPPAGRNGLAMAALVLGVTGLATSIVSVGGLLGAPGLVLGVLALRAAKRTGIGRSQAITGTVTSSIAIVVSVAVVMSALWFAHKTQSCYQFNKVHQWTHCVHQQLDRD